MTKSLLNSVLVRCGDSRLVLLVILLGRFHFFGFDASELADALDAATENLFIGLSESNPQKKSVAVATFLTGTAATTSQRRRT